jgi:GDP/UDP-N,N'-diacetylbacillosamine 2-epimerase (hydrolysing)
MTSKIETQPAAIEAAAKGADACFARKLQLSAKPTPARRGAAKRKICVVTGSRAEYGLLSWLMREIKADADLELQIIATGMHLAPQFGMTRDEILGDGFCIDAEVEMLLASDSLVGMAKSLGLGIIGLTDALARLAPDLVVLLGDRFETFAAAQSAMCLRLPIAHLHGGEATEGAIDEAIRHAVSKMAHLHFVAAEPYRRRVIQLGETPERVFTVGALGVDAIRKMALPTRAELESDLGFNFGEKLLLVTYHPVTLANDAGKPVEALIHALDNFPEAKIIVTGVNADAGRDAIAERFSSFASAHPNRVRLVNSLGQRRYLGVMREAAAVIGNSSSGVIEAPTMGVPTVNIGDRQRGRLRAASVIDCGEDANSISVAISQALSPEFRALLGTMEMPFGDGNAAPRIKKILKTHPLEGLLMKRFHEVHGI